LLEQWSGLSGGRLDKLRKAAGAVVKKKFRSKSQKRKYGNMNKGFTENELKIFLSSVKNQKAWLAFLLQSHLGLRVSEVAHMRLEDIDFNTNKVRINTLKANTVDFLFMPERVRKALLGWIRKHEKRIQEKGWIFFSDNPKYIREHISADWLRNEFRETAFLCNLDEWYDHADDENNKRQKGIRKLHRLSTHSLRHYFVTKVYNHCKNPILTQKLARHQDLKSTQTYINLNLEKLGKVIEDIFESEEVKEKEELMEFMEAYVKFKEQNVRRK